MADGLVERIKLIGEGYDALRADVTELKQGQSRVEARQNLLDVHVLSVESRVASVDAHVVNVDKVQKVLLTEIRGLATKVDRLRERVAARPNP